MLREIPVDGNIFYTQFVVTIVAILIQWDANKWPGILEFCRTRIAYANETNIVKMDSLIDSLTLMKQKTTTSTINHTQAAIIAILEPRALSIEFQEYPSWLRKTGDRCIHSNGAKTAENCIAWFQTVRV